MCICVCGERWYGERDWRGDWREEKRGERSGGEGERRR